MIDRELKPWLIEVNTNPCLEESCETLKQLVPRMLDDALKLTLDPLFAKNVPNKAFPVDGYSDSENLWQLLK
jgi:hypothetical protein